jgi:FlaA1/EpsC-like NDP-sugar epimerase
MILRLKLYGLSLKVATYLLPILAFYLGWYVWNLSWAFLERPVLFSFHGHINHMLFGTLVWAFVSERYRVTSFDELFRERTGARAAWSACLATFCVFLALLYFSRNDVYPRGLLICDAIVLLVLTVMLHAVFRTIFRSSASLAKPTELLVVGADEFARDVAVRLQRLSFAPCHIRGFVRLPDQEVAVESYRVYGLEQLSVLSEKHDIDEAVIALRPSQFSEIPNIMRVLAELCLPARALVDLGQGIVVRD